MCKNNIEIQNQIFFIALYFIYHKNKKSEKNYELQPFFWKKNIKFLLVSEFNLFNLY